jgi:hypothetical protein
MVESDLHVLGGLEHKGSEVEVPECDGSSRPPGTSTTGKSTLFSNWFSYIAPLCTINHTTIMSKQSTKATPAPKSQVLDTFRSDLFKGQVIFCTGG